MHLVIIEAPGKLEKLRSLLPSIRPDVTWQVEGTAGHIRDLPVHGQDPQMLTVGVGQGFQTALPDPRAGKKPSHG